ncbi:MAG: glycosyltransferase [Deltaproteobacteria bacterium]|nr:glycosyltransferase [Deltaproteobacteria bacterium]
MRVRGLWRIKQTWKEMRLRTRVRGLWRLNQAIRELKLRLRVRGLWRIHRLWRELMLRWRMCFGLSPTLWGILRLTLGKVMPTITTKVTWLILAMAKVKGKPHRRSLASDLVRDDRGRVLMLCAHEPSMDPRVGWEAKAASAQFDVTVLGFSREDGPAPEIERARGYRVIRLRRSDMPPESYFRYFAELLPRSVQVTSALTAIFAYPVAASLEITARLALVGFRLGRMVRRTAGARNELASSGLKLWRERMELVRGYLRVQFAPATDLFCRHIAGMSAKPDVIHCNDLDTLLVGVLAKRRFGCTVVYDAHEFWPVMDSACTWIDRTLFSVLERYLIRRADAVVTVNPLLAEKMRAAYQLPGVYSVPNVEPWVEERPRFQRTSRMAELADHRVKFLFQGRFTKARGIEEIILAWPQVDSSKAALFLRGPDNPWRQAAVDLAAELGVLDRSVYFLDAVTEDELVSAAAEADVGIVPYLPLAINERLACPNKLSQYLHAGLMVLTNNLPYVRSVIEEAHAGTWYDSAEPSSFAAVINRIVTDRQFLENCRRNALTFARGYYNWQQHGGLFLDLYGAGPLSLAIDLAAPNKHGCARAAYK